MRDSEPQGSAPIPAQSAHPNGFSSLRKLLQNVPHSHSDLYLAGCWKMVSQELARSHSRPRGRVSWNSRPTRLLPQYDMHK